MKGLGSPCPSKIKRAFVKDRFTENIKKLFLVSLA